MEQSSPKQNAYDLVEWSHIMEWSLRSGAVGFGGSAPKQALTPFI